jgi:hypothetical protein
VPARFDHLVVGIRALADGIAEFERLTGVKAVIGGQHPGRGTENALASLGDEGYFEIIAPQAGATLSAADGKLRALDRLTIVSWAVTVDNVRSAAAALHAAGFATREPQAGSRLTPSGERLEWSVFKLADESIAFAPFFIEWSATTKHPSTTAPAGCSLSRLAVRTPAASRLSEALAALRVARVAVTDGPPELVAEILSGTGANEFRSRD